MGKEKNKEPKQIRISSQQADELMERVKNKQTTQQDVDIILGLIAFNLWLQNVLSRAKITIKKLKSIFGFKRESKKKSKKTSEEDNNKTEDPIDIKPGDSPADVANNESSPENNAKQNIIIPKWDPTKNHGRNAANDYSGCLTTVVPFDDAMLLENKCPDCAKHNTDANLYPVDPCVLVFLDSQPLISGERYQLQRARCAVCQTYFTAPLPDKLVDRPKYLPACISSIAIHHYYAGFPFKRLEMLQAAQKVPLPDATQFDLMDKLYSSVIKYVAPVLRQNAANGSSLYLDDTTGRIIDQALENSRHDKKAIHATALLSDYQGHRIYLFDTNTLTAGKQLKLLLTQRTIEEDFMTMTDASASNFPMLDDNLVARWVITLCLSHGRRRFVELLGDADEDIVFILDLIAQVYDNERYCKQNKLNKQQRLLYHQQHSAPIMEAMRIWFNNLLLYKHVEPNSRLGESIIYMLKRWEWLTQFLRVPGAALDNNICEQAIKVMIRYRNNSLFYKTLYGATIGDAIMSMLHTTVHAGVNIFDYLNILQQYANLVQQHPECWLPWNYQQTLIAMNEPPPVMSICSS